MLFFKAGYDFLVVQKRRLCMVVWTLLNYLN